MPNRLAAETSPYLLQHKNNPVDWYPWGPEALERARTEDKPILVSIGYSACHWCHVMEQETFESDQTAALMNDLFVNIKVDREERPDLDSIYMSAVQAMTGHGGWPLNAFLTPEGVPFFGGTYFPPEDRQGMPSWSKVLSAVSDAYLNRRDAVNENAAQLAQYLSDSTRSTPGSGNISVTIIERAVAALGRSFDVAYGGFGTAPKFPQPALLEFLLRAWKRSGDEAAAGMVRLTLDKMAAGGIYDQIGGGFARYAVDQVWLVPHFEKMLYDNAQLARIYLDAFRAFGDPLHRRIATETLEYIAREMTAPDGGFYATQDADSEGHEGKFFVWTPEEIAEVVGADNAPLVTAYFGVTPGGNFEGKSILHTPKPLSAVASELGIPLDDAEQRISIARQQLFAARDHRVHPGRDDKVITSWNGLMLRAFAEGARVLNRDDFREIARRNAGFVLDTLRQDTHLHRVYKDGRARLNGYLEDYAFVVDGLIALYSATFERRWIDEALALTDVMIAEFADTAPEGAGFFDTGQSHETLVTRPRDLQDGATPSGNSVASEVLVRLSLMTGNDDYGRRAAQILGMMAGPMAEQPTGFGRYLSVLDLFLGPPKEVAIAGQRDDAAVAELAGAVFTRYEPNALLGFADPEDPSLADRLPFLSDRPMVRDGVATAYVCERFACLPPVTSTSDLIRQLEEGSGVSWQEL